MRFAKFGPRSVQKSVKISKARGLTRQTAHFHLASMRFTSQALRFPLSRICNHER
jgi:hypothetical protein